MNIDEQRLSQLLKGTVPHPPRALSADQVTTRPADVSGRSWALPALAAAAVMVIGVTGGVLAANQASGDRPSAASPRGGPTAAGKPPVTASAHAAPRCDALVVTVPNLTGMTQIAAVATATQAGFTVLVKETTAQHAPAGRVIAQSPAPGTRLHSGAVLTVNVAPAPGAGGGTATAPGQNAVTQQVAACSSASASPPAQGTAAGTAAVPNVTGMSSAAAQQVMAAAGFTVTVMVAQAPADQPAAPGTVYGQTPAAGTLAAPGTKLTLYVESRPAA